MKKLILLGLMVASLAWLAYAVLSAPESQVETVSMPSQTEGHHGGELAVGSIGAGGDSSYLQTGRDSMRDDYLIVCDATRNGHPARGGILHPTDGWFYVNDSYRSSGCKARDYPFNGVAHNINGRNRSDH